MSSITDDLRVVQKTLTLIADEKRERDWCDSCRRWVTADHERGISWCPHCFIGILDGDCEEQYERMAREALALLTPERIEAVEEFIEAAKEMRIMRPGSRKQRFDAATAKLEEKPKRDAE